MAKICFLTDRLPTDPHPFSQLVWNQFRILAESQHDVLVVCNSPPPEDERWQHPRLQFIEPFSSWSIRHLPRFIQLLAAHKPDVLHWIEPDKSTLQPSAMDDTGDRLAEKAAAAGDESLESGRSGKKVG